MARINPTLRRQGEPVTVVNFTESGRDDYNSLNYDDEEIETKALIEMPRDHEINRDAASEYPSAEADIYISEDVEVYDASDRSKASEIIRHKTDKTYEVEMVFNEGNGVLQTVCQRK